LEDALLRFVIARLLSRVQSAAEMLSAILLTVDFEVLKAILALSQTHANLLGGE
jgi:hypothetical protein